MAIQEPGTSVLPFFWRSVGLATLLAAVLSTIVLRDGMEITPDGWAYWQGSVRLLEDGKYRYFYAEEPIRCWPPAYSLYLAGWQKILGVSGSALVYSNIVLIATAAGAWTALCLTILRRVLAERRIRYSISIAIYLATLLSVWLRFVLATNLLYVFLPLFLLAACLAKDQKTLPRFLWLGSAGALAAAIMLQTHNSALAFIPVGGCLLILNRHVAPLWKWSAAAIVILTAVVPWYLVRNALGQTDVHSIGLGVARHSLPVYLGQLFYGIAYLLASKPGAVVLPGIVALLVQGYRMARRSEDRVICRDIAGIGLAVAFVVATLLAMFNLTYIRDPLMGRFTLFVPALIVPLGIAIWGWLNDRNRVGRSKLLNYGGLCLLIVLAISLQRTTKRGFQTPFVPQQLATSPTAFVHRSHTIDPDYLNATPRTKGQYILTAPPFYEFMAGDPNDPLHRISRARSATPETTPVSRAP